MEAMEAIEGGEGLEIMGKIVGSLVEKVGAISIQESSLLPYGCEGRSRKGTKFRIVLLEDNFLLLKMSPTKENLTFADAVNGAIGYKAFCRYSNGDQQVIFEWAKNEEEQRQRFSNLERGEKRNKIKRLKRLFWQ